MPKPAIAATHRRFSAFIVKQNGRFLVRQRPAGTVNAHLWEFPNEETSPTAKHLPAANRTFVLTDSKPVFQVRHSITRYRILLEAFAAELPKTAGICKVPGVWRTPAQLERLAFTSAHGKILAAVTGSSPRLGPEIDRTK